VAVGGIPLRHGENSAQTIENKAIKHSPLRNVCLQEIDSKALGWQSASRERKKTRKSLRQCGMDENSWAMKKRQQAATLQIEFYIGLIIVENNRKSRTNLESGQPR
jgi:hypothetical protein